MNQHSSFCPKHPLFFSSPHLSIPLFAVHQCHGLEAGAVLDLSWHWLGALDPALGYIEGNIHTGGDGPRQQADGKLAQEL